MSTTVVLSAQDVKDQFLTKGVALYRQAVDEKKSFSQLLEDLNPSKAEDKSDAFERQLRVAGVRVHSDPARGLWADSCEKFYTTETSRVLFPEYINRTAREALITPPITNELIALTTGINSGDYKAYQIDDQPLAQKRARVTEFAELPRTRLKGKEVGIKVSKFGRILEASYEYLRRVQIPMLRISLARIGLQTDLDRAEDALDVIINGDGNANAATNYNLSSLDAAATVGTLSYRAWLAFLMRFFPHRCTTVIAGEAEMMQILVLQFPNVNPMTILALLQGGQEINTKVELVQGIFVTVRLILMRSAPANKLIGIDRNFALEQVTEIGADITETERVITNQFERVVISETLGFSKILPDATRTLTINA